MVIWYTKNTDMCKVNGYLRVEYSKRFWNIFVTMAFAFILKFFMTVALNFDFNFFKALAAPNQISTLNVSNKLGLGLNHVFLVSFSLKLFKILSQIFSYPTMILVKYFEFSNQRYSENFCRKK